MEATNHPSQSPEDIGTTGIWRAEEICPEGTEPLEHCVGNAKNL